MGRLQKIIAVCLLIPMLISLVFAMSAARIARDAPKTPDVATGHTIPLAVRGLGLVYLDESQWVVIAPYWYTFYAFLGVLIAFILISFLVKAYKGFMDGWRSK
jgi:hypothetical protein